MSSKRSALCPVLFTILCPVPCPLHCPLYIQDIHLALSNAHNTYFWDHFKTSQMLLLYRYTKAKYVTHVHRSAWLVYGIWYCKLQCNIWNIVHIWDISATAPFSWFVLQKYHILCHALRTQCKIVWPTLPLILDLNLPEMHPCLLHPESTKHLLSLGFAINASSWQWEMMALSRSRGTSLKKN